jgi:hypothetical protein
MSPETGRSRQSRSGSSADHLEELGRNARYHRDRHRLYAARLGSSRPVSSEKLGELKRRREVAESSLRYAEETAATVDLLDLRRTEEASHGHHPGHLRR